VSSLLCLAGDGLSASLFAAALHFAWTPADGVAREESWHVRQGQFEFFAARIRKDSDWEHQWPARRPEQRLILRRQELLRDYVICGEMWCTPLERLMPRSRAPVVEISPC
jgi:hypothetical protein